MKKILLMAAVMLASVSSYAQHAVGSWNIQPKVGFNIATITDDNETKTRMGLVLGAEAEYQATDLLSVTTGILYSQQGAKINSNFATGTLKLDYINIPVLANVYVAKGLAVKLGLQAGFMINDKVESGQGNIKAEIPLEDVLKYAGLNAKVNKFDLAMPVGLSYEYQNLQFDARYNFGLTKIVDGDGATSKHSVFQITLGYKFAM